MNKRNAWFTFLPLWTLANLAGWFWGSVFVFPLAALIGVPLLIGLFQYLVLRKFIGIESTWVWASLLVYGSFSLITVLTGMTIGSVWGMLVEIVTFGGLGIVQKKILEFYTFHPGYWLLVSPVAAVAANQIYILMVGKFFQHSPTAFWTTFGLLYGIFTGIALVYMERSNTSDTLTWSS